MNRLLILDGNAILHRAYHALPPLTSPTGQPTGAIYGFVSMIIRLKTDLHPTHIAVCFDREAPTFRKKLYNEYQSQRPKMDEDLAIQIQTVHDVITAMTIPIFEMDGFEADDLIGTIVKKLSKPATRNPIHQIIIATGDRDILQLVVDETVLVYMPVKGLSEAKLYSEKEVLERLGVLPHHIVDWKALAGDSSDNYPGVAGIGPKTAADLVNTFGSIEKLYHALKNETTTLSQKTKEKLIAGEKSAILSKQLATIRTDAPIDIQLEKLAVAALNTQEAKNILGNLGFHSLIKRLDGQAPDKRQTDNKKQHPEKKKDDKASQMDLFS